MNRLEPLQISLAGTSLIEASAGTGKTYTITTLYLRLLLERDLVASEILVVTYTRAATAELRDRIRRRIAGALQAFQSGDPADDNVFESLLAKFRSADDRKRVTGQLARALADFDEAAILTIHGFCQRVLRENAFESLASFQVELLADQQALLEEIVGDYWSNRISTESEGFIRFLMQQRVNVDSMIRLAARASGAALANIVP
ncbi:MAG TPA: exodeoxyribonuclease V subunit beta, partial [Myxococcales bacterium]|nr:exodeoxyribonuclease V subunit beta [Myxococcales bacterium]